MAVVSLEERSRKPERWDLEGTQRLAMFSIRFSAGMREALSQARFPSSTSLLLIVILALLQQDCDPIKPESLIHWPPSSWVSFAMARLHAIWAFPQLVFLDSSSDQRSSPVEFLF